MLLEQPRSYWETKLDHHQHQQQQQQQQQQEHLGGAYQLPPLNVPYQPPGGKFFARPY